MLYVSRMQLMSDLILTLAFWTYFCSTWWICLLLVLMRSYLGGRELDSQRSPSAKSVGYLSESSRPTRSTFRACCYCWLLLMLIFILLSQHTALKVTAPWCFSCYEHLSAVAQAVGVGHYPSTPAVAREIASGSAALQARLIDQAKARIQPGLEFFKRSSASTSTI